MKDLRSFLRELEEKAPHLLFAVDKPVSPVFEVAGIARKFAEEGKFPTIFCKEVVGYSMPVVVNAAVGSEAQRIALGGIGTSREEVLARLQHPIKPHLVEAGPVQDIVKTGADMDLGELPIVTHAEKDAGPYITVGLAVVKDPDTGIRNWGIYRIMSKGERSRLGIYFFGGGTLGIGHIYRKMEARDLPLEIAIVIGNHPCITMSTVFAGRLEDDEMDFAGALLGEPVPLVKCATVDLEVPAASEIVLEGRVLPHLREPEAPFGEFTGYYGPERPNPVIELTAITRRADAIYEDLTPLGYYILGAPGGGGPLAGAWMYRDLKRIIPQVVDVFAYPWAGPVIVKLRKDFDGLGQQAGLAALAQRHVPRMVIVVDEDINIRNPFEVLWALATRTRSDREFSFIQNCLTNPLHPCAHSLRDMGEAGGVITKVIIDATKPLSIPFPERCDVPREYWEGLDLNSLKKSTSTI
jgi:2,5-furandicarboxylate decarboxylase 1